MNAFTRRTLALVIALMGMTSLLCAKRTDDVVVMKNGDRFTGEIKKLEQGQLLFKAAYMLDVETLNWAQVELLESRDNFRVLLVNGRYYTGGIEKRLSTDSSTPDFFVTGATTPVQVNWREVSRFFPVEDSVWKQLNGSIDYGGSFTGGTNTLQSTLSGTTAYEADRWLIEVNGSSVVNRQSGAVSSGRNTFDGTYIRLLTQKSFYTGWMEFLNSQQQDLTLRSSFGGGLGYYFSRKQGGSFRGIAGAVLNNEKYQQLSSSEQSSELVLQAIAEHYRFKTLSWVIKGYAYPNLTTLGRVRMGGQASLSIELYRNLYWKFSVYENYDSRPPVVAPKNDFGTSMSLGWKF